MNSPLDSQLVRDAGGLPVQIGSSFVTLGNKGEVSPMTLNAGVNEISIPQNAVELILYPVSANLLVSERSDLATYDTVAQSTKESFPCSRMDAIYIQGSEGNVVNFRFTAI